MCEGVYIDFLYPVYVNLVIKTINSTRKPLTELENKAITVSQEFQTFCGISGKFVNYTFVIN